MAGKAGKPKKQGPGRPREFDPDAAVDGAVRVFRERGYHATSVGDLMPAMGLTCGSLYKAFADKRAVFVAALDRYTESRHAGLRPRLAAAADGRARLRAVLEFYAEASFGAEGRRGCLVAGSAADLSTLDDDTAARVRSAIARVETLLGDLIRLGHADGSVPPAIDADATAGALLCVLQGLRVVGKLGRTRAQAMAVVDGAMRLLA